MVVFVIVLDGMFFSMARIIIYYNHYYIKIIHVCFYIISFLLLQTPNAEITYTIDPQSEYFAINKKNGDLSIIQPLTNDKTLVSSYTVSKYC